MPRRMVFVAYGGTPENGAVFYQGESRAVMTTENRGTNRIPFEEEITILSPQKLKGRSADIGAGGIGIILPQNLEVGVGVEMEIFSGHAITYGTVRWVRPEGNEYRTGIQFRMEDWSIIQLVLSLRGQEG